MNRQKLRRVKGFGQSGQKMAIFGNELYFNGLRPF
jgi:hypothetical protein